jgi:hypothetical protein
MSKRRRFSDQIRNTVIAAGKAGTSRYKLSKQLEISQSAMSAFMHGGGLGFDTLDKLAELLNLSVKVDSKKGRVR